MDVDVVSTKRADFDEVNRHIDRCLRRSENVIKAQGRLRDKDILVVEDDPDTNILYCVMLKRLGIRVTAVYEAVLALDLVKTRKFHLIIMDTKLPGMDGHECTRRLRQQGCEVPVMCVSAHAMLDQHTIARDAGADFFITKPFSTDKLIAAIDFLVNHPNFNREC